MFAGAFAGRRGARPRGDAPVFAADVVSARPVRDQSHKARSSVVVTQLSLAPAGLPLPATAKRCVPRARFACAVL